jgi:hypothetical protein
MCARAATGRIGGMTTPRSEADMLHMQHAQVAALLARQQEAARLRAQRAAAASPAQPRLAAIEPEAAPADRRSSWSRAPRTRPV